MKPDLGEVQETLLIPLYGRAKDAQSRHSVINDRRARELVDSLDYDFAKFKGGSLPGSVLRTSIFDGWARQFLDEHPTGTIIEIGTGLNTRFDRVDNGHVRWFDLDLPDSIELRGNYFTNTDRCTMLAGSVLETDWFDTVATAPPPYLFIAEAVLLYFPDDQVRAAIKNLADRFPGSLIALDTGGTKMMSDQDRNAAMKTVPARMKWICDEPSRLTDWGLELVESRTFATPQPAVAKSWPARYRYGMPVLSRIAPAMVNTYKINLFRLTKAV